MTCTIREATESDVPTLQQLNAKLFEDQRPYDTLLAMDWPNQNEEYYAQRVREESGCAFIAEVDGVPVGYLIGHISPAENYRQLQTKAELENMLVEHTERSRGVGSALVERFLTWAKQQKADVAAVSAYAGNTQAAAFYRKNGFADHSLTLERPL